MVGDVVAKESLESVEDTWGYGEVGLCQVEMGRLDNGKSSLWRFRACSRSGSKNGQDRAGSL
jgi:hypothetical protein